VKSPILASNTIIDNFNSPAYRITPREAEETEEQLTDLIHLGHIQPSSPPCASPAFVISKKDTTKICLVTDYHALNKATVKNRYPLPQIEELLDNFQGAQWLTKLDLSILIPSNQNEPNR
jgi:hypothetical protein